MGSVISNLKAKLGIDTQDFRKGLKDGEKAMGEFKGAAGDKISEFSALFGVNMSSVTNAVGLAGKSLGFLKQSFVGAAQGGDVLAISMKALKWLFASSGIGALILALSSLVTYFTKTTAGAKELAIGMGKIKAAGTVLGERLGKWGGGLWDMLKGNFSEGYRKMAESMYKLGDAMGKAAEQGKMLVENERAIVREEREFNVIKSQNIVELEEARLKSRDLDYSARERLKWLMTAAEIEKKNDKEQLKFAAERILNAQTALQIDTQSREKKDALAEAYIRYNEIVAESILFDRSLSRQKNALIKEINAEFEALKKSNELEKIYIGPKTFANKSKIDPNALRPGPNVKTELQGVNSELQQMYDTIETSMENVTTGFGDWMGNFAAGLSGFRDLRQMIGNSFGDMLISLGNIAIKTGVGVEVIKKALASLSGVGAIAVGVGLVAFGSAIKGSIQQINTTREGAAGLSGYTQGSQGGSVTYGTASGVTPSKLRLDGTVNLKLSGADLIALLNSENTRVEVVT